MEGIQKDPSQTSRRENHICHEHTLGGINSILDATEIKISELEDIPTGTIQNEGHRRKQVLEKGTDHQ